MGVLTSIKKKEKWVLRRSKKQEKRQSAFLKVVHPHGYVEIFLKPITAGEIMRRYPRHCIARPDFFDYPWIVVHPESVLVPGEVFFLVSHRTVDKILKEKTQQIESPNIDKNHNQKVTKKDQQEGYCNGRVDRDSDRSFYESWYEMQRNLHLHEESCDDQLDLGLDSPLELQRVKSCLKKANSGWKRRNLKVSFGPPVVISDSRSGSLDSQQDDLVCKFEDTHCLTAPSSKKINSRLSFL